MARISLAGHWKFRRLCRAIASLAPDALTGPAPIARGLLELLWEAGYAAVSDYVGAPTDLADALDWKGDPVVLVRLLVDAGFLDARDGGASYVIHDLWPNAPRYAQLRYLQKHPGTPPPWKPAASSELNSESSSELNSEQNGTLPLGVEPPLSSPGSTRPGTTQGQRRGAPPSPPDHRRLVPLGYELVRQGKRFESDADAKDALKAIAARYEIPYDAASITAALDALKHARAPLFVVAAH